MYITHLLGYSGSMNNASTIINRTARDSRGRATQPNNRALFSSKSSVEVTLKQLQSIKTPKPTKTWRPLGHAQFVDYALNALSMQNYEVTSYRFAVGKDRPLFFGLLEVASPDSGVRFAVGLRNAHDKTMCASACVGTNVLVCDNLAFRGEYLFKSKHVGDLYEELPKQVNDLVGTFGAVWNKELANFNAMQAKRFSASEANDVIVRLYQIGAITGAMVSEVVDEYWSPSFKEHGGDSAYTLYQAVTQAYKGRGVDNLINRSQTLNNFFDGLLA